jgi:hypothetical protein
MSKTLRISLLAAFAVAMGFEAIAWRARHIDWCR